MRGNRGCLGDRGAVTVEAALALCSLVVVLALAVGAVAAVSAHLRCLDAAREGARLMARGEPDRAREVVKEIGPAGAAVSVSVVGDEVTVEVSAGGPAGLPGLRVSGRAVGVLEPGAVTPAASGSGEPSAASGPP